jgi:hypothetical protein
MRMFPVLTEAPATTVLRFPTERSTHGSSRTMPASSPEG